MTRATGQDTRDLGATRVGLGLVLEALLRRVRAGGRGAEEKLVHGSGAHQRRAGDVGRLAPSAPATFSSVTTTGTITAQNCVFAIGTAVEASPHPPVFHAWLARQGCGADAFLVLGRSYSAPATLLAGNGHAIVGLFSAKETPSGAAYQKARLVDVDGETGVRRHEVTLAALPPSGTGVVAPETLLLFGDGTVIVQGQKVGVLPGENGSGSSFTATWRKLVRSEAFSPPPTEIEAF